jgi:type II secretory pathway pseudopilin PulG
MSARFCQALSLLPVAVIVLVAAAAPRAAQDSTSAAAARQLAEALDAAKLDAIAAVDPEDPTRYAAALYFAGSQLLVVSAQYAAPTLLQTKMYEKNYRDIYIDLNSASISGSKVFIIDTNANGLQAKPDDGAVDTYEDGTRQLTLDGEWRNAKMSEDEYMKAYAAADARYARILALLSAQARGTGQP